MEPLSETFLSGLSSKKNTGALKTLRQLNALRNYLIKTCQCKMCQCKTDPTTAFLSLPLPLFISKRGIAAVLKFPLGDKNPLLDSLTN